ILEKQIDGSFCVDGDLLYNPNTNSLVYVYRYRNQFMHLDTTLNTLFKGYTIDTISKVKIKVSEAKTANGIKFILSSPPLIVNKKSYASGNYLFIHSNIKSR